MIIKNIVIDNSNVRTKLMMSDSKMNPDITERKISIIIDKLIEKAIENKLIK